MGFDAAVTFAPDWRRLRPIGEATMFLGSSPTLHERWAREACRSFGTPAEQDLLFVNAWKEWGEGIHLEPSRCWGRGYTW